MDKLFNRIFNWACENLSLLGSKSNHISKKGHWSQSSVNMMAVDGHGYGNVIAPDWSDAGCLDSFIGNKINVIFNET